MNIDKLIKGNKKFKDAHFPKLEGKFDDLVVNGQKPQVLFIGCSDSRVVPDLIVDSNPGDMFILRNIGNFVPPYRSDNDFHGSSAAIEYAVSVLNVKDIIVCGHSHCGACASLYQDLSDEPHLQHVKKWLELGHKAKEYTLLATTNKDDKQQILRTTERISIKHQLEYLLTYPEIFRKVKSGELDIHGWYYKIEDGSIEYYDGESCDFKLLGDN
ncbi:MAG: carbonic anhydrase [Campylobacterota bacterium]|nr:carbonic anhydrase [Campylobacterota bacterium]